MNEIWIRQLERRLEDSRSTLRTKKCKFSMQQVSYLGYLVSAQGLETLPEHISPVLEAPPAPSNVAELKSHLGMLTYYHWFLPDVSTKLEPLHELLCSGQAWKWTAARQMAFEKTKRMLQEVLLLVHYHPNKPISGVI